MNRDQSLALVATLQQQVTALELMIEEGDPGSIIDAREPLQEAINALAALRAELQASQPQGMCVEDVRTALLDYSDSAMVEVCVPMGRDGVGAFYLVKSITDLVGTSPIIPLIDLGECISC